VNLIEKNSCKLRLDLGFWRLEKIASMFANIAMVIKNIIFATVGLRVVGVENFGFFSLILSYCLLVAYIDLGVGLAVTKYLSNDNVLEKPMFASSISGLGFWTTNGVLIITAPILFGFVYFSDGCQLHLSGNMGDRFSCLTISIALSVMSIPFQVADRYMIACAKTLVASISKSIAALISIALLFVFYYFGVMSLTVLSLVNFLPILVGSIANSVYVYNSSRVNLLCVDGVSFNGSFQLVKVGVKMVIIQMLLVLQSQTDNIIASNVLSLTEVSSVAFYSRFVGPMFFLCNTVMIQDWGVIGRLHKQRLWIEVRKLMLNQVKSIAQLHLFIGFSLIIFLHFALEGITANAIPQNYPLLITLIFSSVILSLNSCVVLVFSLFDDLRVFTFITFFATFIVVIVKMLLVKKCGPIIMIGGGSIVTLGFQTLPTLCFLLRQMNLRVWKIV
jgi:O-antigen/teichoic acid export membrane protein